MAGGQIVKEVKKGYGLYQPNYEQNIFSIIPTAMHLLGVTVDRPNLLSNKNIKASLELSCCFDVEKVVCIIVDSVGVRQLQLFEKMCRAWHSLGALTISSVFPTITSAAIVSIHFGLPPERHGIVGHKVWFQQLGTVVDTLKMASIKALSMDRLVRSGIDARVLLLENGLHDELENIGVKHVELMPSSIAKSGLSHMLGIEEVTVGFDNVVDAFSTLRLVLDKYSREKMFVNIYLDIMDAVSHKYGPRSDEYHLAAHHIEEVFTNFLKNLDGEKDIAFFFFSDHGQEEVFKDKTIEVSEEEAESVFQHLRSPPGRSGRVVHFYVKEGEEEKVERWVEEKVGENGVLMSFNEVCKLFKLKPRRKFKAEVKSRMGELVLVMKEGAEFKFQKKEEKEKIIEEKWNGSHGSMTLNELLVPLLAARCDVLKQVLGV